MARNQGPLTSWPQYLAVRAVTMGLTSFDIDRNLRTAGWIGRTLYHLDARHRKRARASIAMAYPHADDATLDLIARGSFEHFVQLAIEVLHTPRLIHRDGWAAHTQFHNLGPALKLLNARQPMILLTGHLGNWELLGYLLATLGYDLDAIARPIDNPLINRWLLGIRERQGMRIITKWDAAERMTRVLSNRGALGFIADQNAGDKGLFVPFFGRLASTYKSIGLLAMRKQVPVVCGFAHRIGPAFRFEVGVVDVIHPQDWADRDDALYYITARYTRAIETMVRRRPEQYLWMHRRWKSRPRHELQGKPMPGHLRKHLEQLPWMTDAELAELERPIDPGTYAK
ncbi:lysophospholipid acyltransferase family protein [Phycisphaerales bacterium AB-hyl4]|uniref:Lysophospholipid acyltransferase family protein n=1 Tax=Natronomicrosphaera hydrolytica TaxID=3242702 RepID=A0ABV4U1P1_9BACT